MHNEVQKYYGETLSSSGDLLTSACCTTDAPPDYIRVLLPQIHEEVARRYYGCGLVLPEALDGLHVLDLGCGAGRDVYLLSGLVGEQGHVTGVDMTPEQLAVAREHADFHRRRFGYEQSNVSFVEANIEALDAPELAAQLGNASFDLIVSNCVINLAVDKAAVLRSAWRMLKPGGEMYFSDIYASRRVPAELAADPVLYGECLAGALYWGDFLQLAKQAGFADPRLVTDNPVEVTDPELAARVGPLRFYSATYRLFRMDGLEPGQEDYGQHAVYKGSVTGHADAFRFDKAQTFPVGKPIPVSGNTARLLSESRYSRYFDVIGSNDVHLGAFDDKSVAFPFSVEARPRAGGGCC